MPVKRRTAKARRTPLALAETSYVQRWAFTKSWNPPIPGYDHAPAWLTWPEYFADYASVRNELLAALADGDYQLVTLCGDQPPFAERIEAEIAAFAPGAAHDVHDHCSLRHAHIYVPGDQHVHDGSETRLGAAVEIERKR